MRPVLHALILSLALAGCKAPPAAEQAQANNAVAVTAPQQLTAAADRDLPALTGRVVDQADLLTPEKEAELTTMLAGLEQKTKHQFVIATVDSLGGLDITSFGILLGNRWGIGRKGVDDGVILIVAPTEKQARIAVGDGLSSVLTNSESQTIMDGRLVPFFAAGDYPRGIESGTKAIIAELETPEGQSAR